jgi:dihydropteroate synthase
MLLDCAGKSIDLSRPNVMGVLNVTPDSFSDGGLYMDPARAAARAAVMAEEGASIIDVGGESTRPRAAVVDADEQLRRVIPVIEAVRAAVPVVISVDTSDPRVMTEAVDAGAGMINDVRALRVPGAVAAAATAAVPVCLMHMQGEPATMQDNPTYVDVVREVKEALQERVHACQTAGIPRGRLLIDPGFGFGKALAHNIALMRHLEAFQALGLPLVVGVSRKSMIGQLLGAPVDQRLYGALALAVMAVLKGARIVRSHDVRATLHAVTVCHRIQQDDPGIKRWSDGGL